MNVPPVSDLSQRPNEWFISYLLLLIDLSA